MINFRLKNDFDGATFRAQSGLSSKFDRPSQFIAGSFGRNLAGGRGNLALALEYSNQDPTFAYDRGYFAERQQFNQVQFDPAGTNGDGVPDRLFFTDATRSLYLTEGGTFTRAVDVANPATFTARTNANGTVVRVPRVYRFTPTGNLVEADYGSRDFRFGETTPGNFNTLGPTNTLGGDGASLRRYGNLQPDLDRYSANIIGKFEVSPAVIPYFEARYVRLDFVQESSPTFGQTGPSGAATGARAAGAPYFPGGGSFGNLDNALFVATGSPLNSGGIPIRLDNPYLNDQARTQIRALVGPTAQFFRLNRNNLDLGSRGEDGRRETYRGVLGVRGTFNDDWRYDIAATYGRVDVRTESLNNRLQQRFELATDAARDPASGQIVCRSRLTAPAPQPTNTASASTNAVNTAKNAALAADIAACVPINLLGEGNISAAARDYVNATTVFTGRHTQFDALAFVAGDLSEVFELPGGPIGFSFGAEYRRETARSSFGDVVRSGLTFLNAIPDLVAPALKFKEVFGEVNVPLLADVPGFDELTATGAIRYSDYNNRTGGVIAWNAGGLWSPFEGLRLRGNYSVSVRTPTLEDLYSPPTQNFANFGDPCDVANINSGVAANRPRNCLAAGVPVGFINLPARGASTELLSSGNPELVEERAKSYTFGGIFTPAFLPGLSFKVDYYHIEIDDVIANVSAQLTANLCYDSASLDNQFCRAVIRNPDSTFARPGIVQETLNFASRDAACIDFDLAYRTALSTDFDLSARGVATYVIKRNNFPDISNPSFRDQILLELGDPDWAFNIDLDLKYKKLTFGYEMRYIGKQVVNFAEDIFSSNSTPEIPAAGTMQLVPASAGAPQNPDYSDPLFYKEVFYHDFRLELDASERFSIYGGVDNAFDREPPLGVGGNGAGSGICDNVGRFFYAGVKINL